MSLPPMGDTAWHLGHMNARDQRAMDEQIGRFAASLSRGVRKVGALASSTRRSRGPARQSGRTRTLARAEQPAACEAC